MIGDIIISSLYTILSCLTLRKFFSKIEVPHFLNDKLVPYSLHAILVKT